MKWERKSGETPSEESCVANQRIGICFALWRILLSSEKVSDFLLPDNISLLQPARQVGDFHCHRCKVSHKNNLQIYNQRKATTSNGLIRKETLAYPPW